MYLMYMDGTWPSGPVAERKVNEWSGSDGIWLNETRLDGMDVNGTRARGATLRPQLRVRPPPSPRKQNLMIHL
jgi:hypothetical protein